MLATFLSRGHVSPFSDWWFPAPRLPGAAILDWSRNAVKNACCCSSRRNCCSFRLVVRKNPCEAGSRADVTVLHRNCVLISNFCGAQVSFSVLGFAVGGALVSRAPDTQSGVPADARGLMLSPLLLFRVLCHRTLFFSPTPQFPRRSAVFILPCILPPSAVPVYRFQQEVPQCSLPEFPTRVQFIALY